MRYTFKLKEPKSDKETLILFACEFKAENKKFIYSTGEKINPINWDKENKSPYLKGKNKSEFAENIILQLSRYSTLMITTETNYKTTKDVFTTTVLKKVFQEEFKKVSTGKTLFFDIFDLFTAEKINQMQWSKGTAIRYQNIKNTLKNFEIKKNYPLTFGKIDNTFYSEFVKYCLEDLKHINNTFLKNLVLFKTFMRWAIKNKYTYNSTFLTFNINDSGNTIIKETSTSQIALTITDLNNLMQHEFKTKKLEHSRDIFVFQCVTGMRYGELFLINRSNVTENEIVLKEIKGVFKDPRNIPLTTLSKYILLKYEYALPLITNQKQNDYIKDVFQEMEYTAKIEKTSNRGRDIIRSETFFYNRICTHTARRTFITMMKRQGKNHKLIASATGHKNIATLDKYYQVDTEQTKEAMDDVFNIEIPLRKIKDS